MAKKVGKYELGRTLGEGTFGKVKYAINTETNEAVAIKVLDKEKIQKQNMGTQIKREISIMKIVSHRYIVRLIEVLASKTKIFIVLELVTGGELFEKIVSVGKLSEEQAKFYFVQLVEGVEYCHSKGVCHRDLKPENLLLDQHGNLKISDFGLSSLYVGDAEGDGGSRTALLLHTTCGTPNYVAPEVLGEKGYKGEKADVWSIGVILYVLLAGFLPFEEETLLKLFEKIKLADFRYPSWFSSDVRSLLDRMMRADPDQRISLSEVKDLPWFRSVKRRPDGEVASLTESSSSSSSSESSTTSSTSSSSSSTSAEVEKSEKESTTTTTTNTGVIEPSTSVDHENEEQEDEEDDDDPSSGGGGGGGGGGRATRRGSTMIKPKALNAFDLVSKCGGFLLDRMFSPQTFACVDEGGPRGPVPLSSSVSVPVSVSALDVDAASGIIRFGNVSRRSNSFRFSSPVSPPEDLMRYVVEAFLSLGCQFQGASELLVSQGRAKGTLLTPKGMLGIGVQVFYLTSSLTLLEIQRGKGDILEWNNILQTLVETKINHLLLRPRIENLI